MANDNTLTLPRADADEEAVLGIALVAPARVPELVRSLTPEDFYVPANQAVARAVHDLNDAREPIDPVLVWNRIRANGEDRAIPDGIVHMHTLVSSAPPAPTLGYHIKAVKEASARRRVAAVSTLGHSMSANPASGDVSSIVEAMRSELDTISGEVNSGQVPMLSTELDDVLTEIERVGTEGAVVGIPTGFPDLDAKLHGLRPGQMIVLAGRPAMGKALALDTAIPTPTGWTTMGDIKQGDVVYDAEGLPTRVVAVTDVMTDRDCYTVTFSDGESIVADAEHLWTTERATARHGNVEGPWIRGTFTTRELREHVNECVEFVPIARALEADILGLPAKSERVGLYLARLSKTNPTAAAKAAPEVQPFIDPAAPAIPETYLRAPVTERIRLLLGLTQGAFVNLDGRLGNLTLRVDYLSLALSIHELLATLGAAPVLTQHGDSGQYEVSVPDATTARRYGNIVEGITHRRIVSVEPTASVPVRCIQVDNKHHLYLAGRGMVPTHNSTLMLDFLRTAAFQYGKSTLLFSLEMSQQEVVTRLLSAQGRIEMDALQTGTLGDDDWQRIHRLYSTIQETKIGIDDTPGITVADIRAKARAFQEEHGLDMIAVDYLQLMSPVRRSDSRQQEVSEMSRNLKLLAKELGVPVIALSQLNRGSEQRGDKRPMLSDLRESGAIEQDSDVVILLHRDEVYNPEVRVGEADLIIAKQRSGPTGIVPVVSQLHYSRFMPAARSFDDADDHNNLTF